MEDEEEWSDITILHNWMPKCCIIGKLQESIAMSCKSLLDSDYLLLSVQFTFGGNIYNLVRGRVN